VNYYANELWAKFLRQADIAKDDLFRSYIPKWVEVAVKKAIKVGYPSQVTITIFGLVPLWVSLNFLKFFFIFYFSR
jgi:hypothetical protein